SPITAGSQPLPVPAIGQQTHTHLFAFEIVACAVLVMSLPEPRSPAMPVSPVVPSTSCHMSEPSSSVMFAGVATSVTVLGATSIVCGVVVLNIPLPICTEHDDW